jgi:actin-related protein 3
MHSSYDTRTENRHRVELTWWGACQTAKKVKERFCYTCPDIAKEFAKYDKDQAKWVRQFQGVHPRTKEPWECDVGYERFLAPEVFFNPEICGGARGSGQIYKTPLSEMVYECVDKSAIDNRRGLFDNIVLSGGQHVQGLRPPAAARYPEDLRQQIEAQRGANWGRDQESDQGQRQQAQFPGRLRPAPLLYCRSPA